MIRPIRLGSLFLLAQLILVQAPAWAQDKDLDPSTMSEAERDEAFEENLDKAGKLYEEKNFEESLVYFKRAYKVRPEPKLLFNMGIISERLGRIEEAVGFYNTFVTSPDVSLDLRSQGQKRLDVLRPIAKSQRDERERQEREERERQDKLNPNPNNTNNPNPNGPPKEKPEEPSNAGRITSYVVAGSGIALAGVGGFMLLTLDDAQAFAQEPSSQDRRNARDSRNTQKSAGTILVASGGAMALTGIIIWALTGQDEAPSPQKTSSWHITPSLSPSGGAVSIFGRF